MFNPMSVMKMKDWDAVSRHSPTSWPLASTILPKEKKRFIVRHICVTKCYKILFKINMDM